MLRKRMRMMVLESEDEVDSIVRKAANHQLQCLYKIGVYGRERQHELYFSGSWWNYRKLLKELNSEI